MAEDDIFGFFETMIEYYTGRDASQMTEWQMAVKLAHIQRIRKIESENTISEQLSVLLNAKRS